MPCSQLRTLPSLRLHTAFTRPLPPGRLLGVSATGGPPHRALPTLCNTLNRHGLRGVCDRCWGSLPPSRLGAFCLRCRAWIPSAKVSLDAQHQP